MSTPNWVQDPHLGSSAAAAAYAAAEARDSAQIRELLTQAPAPERSVVLTSATDPPGIAPWLAGLLRDDPNDEWLNTLAATAYLSWAWEARTGMEAKYVTAQGAELFRARAGAAADIVVHTRAMNPSTTSIGLPALTVALARRGTPEEVMRALSEVDSTYPDDYPISRTATDFFAAKWYGSNDQMWQFATERAAAAPDGSALAALPAGAVVEQVLWAAKKPGARPKKDLAAALDLAAERSMLHPAWTWTPSAWVAGNELVMANLAVGRTGEARRLNAQLTSDRRTSHPWHALAPIERPKYFAQLVGS